MHTAQIKVPENKTLGWPDGSLASCLALSSHEQQPGIFLQGSDPSLEPLVALILLPALRLASSLKQACHTGMHELDSLSTVQQLQWPPVKSLCNGVAGHPYPDLQGFGSRKILANVSRIGIVIGPKGSKIKLIQASFLSDGLRLRFFSRLPSAGEGLASDLNPQEKTGVTRIDTSGEMFTIVGPQQVLCAAIGPDLQHGLSHLGSNFVTVADAPARRLLAVLIRSQNVML